MFVWLVCAFIFCICFLPTGVINYTFICKEMSLLVVWHAYVFDYSHWHESEYQLQSCTNCPSSHSCQCECDLSRSRSDNMRDAQIMCIYSYTWTPVVTVKLARQRSSTISRNSSSNMKRWRLVVKHSCLHLSRSLSATDRLRVVSNAHVSIISSNNNNNNNIR